MSRFVLKLLSLLCVGLGQPATLSWLGPVSASLGFAMFWYSLKGHEQKRIGKIAFAWFFFVQLIQLSWMANLTYQGWYILFVYVFLSAGMALQFSLITRLIYKVQHLDSFAIAFIASLWTLFEWSRLYFLCGFAFNFAGIALSCSLLSLQTASLFGVLGMSFWVVFTNLVAFQSFQAPSILRVFQWGLFAIVPYLYGWLHITYHNHQQGKIVERQMHSIALVQTALTPSQKYLLRGKEQEFIQPLEQWNRIMKMLFFQNKPSLDLIVFPEAALPLGLDQAVYPLEEFKELFIKHFGGDVEKSFPLESSPFIQRGKATNAFGMQTLANLFQANLIAGLDYQGVSGRFYSSAFFFAPGSTDLRRYDKRVLLPLAEYMPFSFLSFLSSYYGIQDFFTPGTRHETFLGKCLLAPSICYDELFPELIREARKGGAQLFVNLSNDGWYPDSKLPKQHFTQGLIRAVENGCPLVRACNTGVTSSIDSFGRVIDRLEGQGGDVEQVSGVLVTKLSTYHYKTLFTFWGNLPLLIGCTCCIVFFLLGIFRKRFSLLVGGLKGNRA